MSRGTTVFDVALEDGLDGGTSEVLDLERAKASFKVDAMSAFLVGGANFSYQRAFIQDAHGAGGLELHAEMTREDNVQESLQHFMDVHWKYVNRAEPYRPKGQDMTFMSNAKFGRTGGLSLHYGVFMSTLRSQCSEDQKGWWLDRAMRLNFIGCYAQTELGHGSNVRGIQTTATFDPHAGSTGDGEWIMDTPTLQSIKWWSTGLPSSTHAIVYAQMMLGGKSHGVHVFLVQLRGGDLKPLPGIEVGDIGAKAGDNDCAIGYLRMKSVRIPRRHLMEKRQHVTPDGTYVRHDGSSSSSGSTPSTASKGGSAVEGAGAGPKQKPKSKAHYITMLKTRVALVNTAGGHLAKACVIAARYSAVRHQGFKNTSADSSYTTSEYQILDYKVQQYRVLKWVAAAYGMQVVARWLLERRKAAEQAEKASGGDAATNADLPEVHASASGLKAFGCAFAADGIEDLRRACGGHGYLMSSGIAPLEADFKGPNATAEGDAVVLLLQTARFLVKSVETARGGDVSELPGMTACFAPLADPAFTPLTDGKPPPILDPALLLENTPEARGRLVELFKYRALVACTAAGDALREGTRLQGSVDGGRMASARVLHAAATAFVKYFMLSKFVESVDAVDHAAAHRCGPVLHNLVLLSGTSDLLDGAGWLGLVTPAEASCIDNVVSVVCKALRPETIGLVDAFEIPDRILNSALGRADGKVYEALFAAARKSSLNVDQETGETHVVPPFFDAVKPYLDPAFLDNAGNIASGGAAGTVPAAKL